MKYENSLNPFEAKNPYYLMGKNKFVIYMTNETAADAEKLRQQA